MHLYDYQRIDPTNPRQLASDEALPNLNETNHSSTSVAIWFYIVGGIFVYSMTRIMYDTEWDRYYHINYPATMEYIDVLSLYYSRRLLEIEGVIPRSLGQILPKMSVTKAYKRWEDKKKAVETKKDEEELVDAILSTVLEADKIPDKLETSGKEK